MIYTNFVELHSQMLYAKFKNHRPSGSEEEDFKVFCYLQPWQPSWSCDLDHLYKLSFPLPKDAPHKVWLCLAKWFQRRRCLNIIVIYMYIALGQGQTTPWAQNIFINVDLLSICSFLASFLPFNDIFLFFSHSNAWQPKLTLP